ncbi:hypothetical protein [Methanobrevibacter sp.]|uniref:hypothetical protein n=1 Tax=Methanobrevibacter sp. TaxID=66852 RepID=UPI00386CBFFD
MNRKEIFYQDKATCKIPFTHIENDITDSSLSLIDELYGAADVLSIQNAKKHRRILLALAITGTLITMAFLLYDEAELYGLIFACIIMILFLFFIYRWANRLDCHRKYLEYRVLAETLRLQFFISTAGLKVNVANILPWFIKKAIPWIEEILLSLPVEQVNEKKPIIDSWIRNQRTYHEEALKKAEDKKHRDDRITKIVLLITIISYIVAVLFEIHMLGNPSIEMPPNVIRAILKIVLGTMSAATLFTSSYYGKMSLKIEIDDHKRMIELYDLAENDILENGETEEQLMDLAREFLIENSTWYAYQKMNSPDVVM